MTRSPRVLAVAVQALAALLAVTAAGCGDAGGAGQAGARSPASRMAGPAGRGTVPAADRPACAQLIGRLQRVTQAISASSELIANSLDKRQLRERIATEETQLRRSAELMSEGRIPAPLAQADRHLVTALRTFSADFAQAKGPAGRGDFQAAVDAMGDKPVVQQIVAASATIQAACGQQAST
jgi:hypothetical protein